MALLTILSFPDPRLHTVAKPVAVVDERIRTLAADMIETMYESKGVGLAATQVDVHERVVVMDVSEEHNQPLVMINPELLWKSEERIKGEEGCLSVPGVFDAVERAAQVKIQALDEHGELQTYAADGLMAVCIQHEMDHLMGKVLSNICPCSNAPAFAASWLKHNANSSAKRCAWSLPARRSLPKRRWLLCTPAVTISPWC